MDEDERVEIEREQERQRKIDAALRIMAGDSNLRPLLWWILERTHVYTPSLVEHRLSEFAEGERNIGLQIIARMYAVDPTLYPLMLMDAAKGEQRE
jgi:hypothetical protein